MEHNKLTVYFYNIYISFKNRASETGTLCTNKSARWQCLLSDSIFSAGCYSMFLWINGRAEYAPGGISRVAHPMQMSVFTATTSVATCCAIDFSQSSLSTIVYVISKDPMEITGRCQLSATYFGHYMNLVHLCASVFFLLCSLAARADNVKARMRAPFIFPLKLTTMRMNEPCAQLTLSFDSRFVQWAPFLPALILIVLKIFGHAL